MWVEGLGFGVWGLGFVFFFFFFGFGFCCLVFGLWFLWFGVWCWVFGVWGVVARLLHHSTLGLRVIKKKKMESGAYRGLPPFEGFRVSGFGFRVSGFRFRVSGFRFRVSGFRFRVSDLGFQVSGFGFKLYRGLPRREVSHRGRGKSVLPIPLLDRKVDVRLPGNGNSNSHGSRPVHLIITMLKWTRNSRLSIKNSPSDGAGCSVQGARTTLARTPCEHFSGRERTDHLLGRLLDYGLRFRV